MFSPYLFSSFAHALPEAKPPIPPKEYFPLTASLGEEVANCSPACGGAGWRSQTEGAVHFATNIATPIPPTGYFPLTASLGEEVANCSPACGGAGWRSQTEGGCARGNKHRHPHPPFGVLPPYRFAGGRGKFPLTTSLGEEVAYV
jgi:hypothetical protein